MHTENAFLCAALVALHSLAVLQAEPAVQAGNAEAAAVRESSVRMTVCSRQETAASYSAYIRIPQFPDFPALTARIQETVEAERRGFIADAGENPADGYDLPASAFQVRWKAGQIDENAVSLILEIYRYTGGAHGSTMLVPFNYDCRGARFLTLADLVGSPAPGWTEKLAADIRSRLEEQLLDGGDAGRDEREREWIREGTGNPETDFACFLFDGDRLTVRFGQYQVAPYSEGMPEVALWIPDYRTAEGTKE